MLDIHKALQFIGDVYLGAGDHHTAICMYTVALEGFTQMNIHRSRAECMVHLGDISRQHGNTAKAAEFWGRARPLFELSSQTNQITAVDDRLACDYIGPTENVLNINVCTCLAEQNADTVQSKIEEIEI
jgi:hypothetical protein